MRGTSLLMAAVIVTMSLLLLSGAFQNAPASGIAEDHAKNPETIISVNPNSHAFKPGLSVKPEEMNSSGTENTDRNYPVVSGASSDSKKGKIAEREATAAAAAVATALFGLAF
jgi:hypothetical protein